VRRLRATASGGASNAEGDQATGGAVRLVRDLSLSEAAELYELSVRTLGQRIRNGEIPAYKSEGPNRGEWRIRQRDLQAFGYERRTPGPPASTHAPAGAKAERDPQLVALEKTVRELERRLAGAERSAGAAIRRAEESDRRLGEALMEVGRLRAALAAETSPSRARGTDSDRPGRP
jgi:excisionase family DNA binding protein